MSIFGYGFKDLRAERREKRGAVVIVQNNCERIRNILNDDKTRIHLESALRELELVVKSVNDLEVMINDLDKTTNRWFGSKIKAQYLTDLHAIIANLNLSMTVLIGPDMIMLDHTGLEAVVGLNREQRIKAMKPIFDLLVSFCRVIQKHSYTAIQHVLDGVEAHADLKEEIKKALDDLKLELRVQIKLI